MGSRLPAFAIRTFISGKEATISAAGKRLRLADRGIALPLTLGHETAGEIVSVGPEVKDRKVGEMVLIYPWIGCGVCRVCRAGSENLCMKPRCLGVHCDGGYSDQIVVPNSKYLLPLDGLDPVAVAPYACSGVTTYSALKKLGSVIKEEPVLIVGAGGLGLMALSILKAMGGKGAVVVDIDAKRRAAALEGRRPRRDRRLGSRRARANPVGARRPWLGGDRPCRQPRRPRRLFSNSLAKGGKMIMVGLFGGAAPWSLPLIPMKATTIEGSYTGNLAETRELLDLVRAGGAPKIPIRTRPLSDATAALEDLKAGRVVGRVVLTP